MANVNTFAGFQNLPAVVPAVTTEFTYKVPASGTYAGLPSPSQIAGNALVVPALSGDVNGGVLDYGRPFSVKINGVINSAQSENITVTLYNVTNSVFTSGFTAATGTGQTALATTSTMATGAALKFNFFLEAILQWDSISGTLSGYYYGHSSKGTPANIGPTTLTNQVTSLKESDLNFYFTLTASVATTDSLGPFDFTVERS
jgi:hypothetical protein